MIGSRGESRYINSFPSDDVRDLRVIEDVNISLTISSVTEDSLANSDTQIINEIYEFSKSTSNDVDMLLESSTLIPTDIHIHDNDTSDVKCEPVVDYIVTPFSYPPVGLWTLTMIH